MTCSHHALALLALTLLIPGCTGDRPAPIDGTNPIESRLAMTDLTLDALWPNTDGSFWRYETSYREWEVDPEQLHLYDTEEEVPPAPLPPEIVKRYLGRLPAAEGGTLHRYTYGLTFNGYITTQSGVTAQHLEESEGPIGGKLQARPVNASPDAALLASLYRARPDLRAKLRQFRPEIERPLQFVFGPTFLFGYAWEKTSEHIGAYGDVDQDLSWKYLVADLGLGASFDHQLVPGLADDVWLHGMIGRQFLYSLPDGSSVPAVECVYVVDYGVSLVTDEQGYELGYFCMFDYGTVTYAAGVGPVACTQRSLVQTGSWGDTGSRDWRLALRDYEIAAP